MTIWAFKCSFSQFLILDNHVIYTRLYYFAWFWSWNRNVEIKKDSIWMISVSSKSSTCHVDVISMRLWDVHRSGGSQSGRKLLALCLRWRSARRKAVLPIPTAVLHNFAADETLRCCKSFIGGFPRFEFEVMDAWMVSLSLPKMHWKAGSVVRHRAGGSAFSNIAAGLTHS